MLFLFVYEKFVLLTNQCGITRLVSTPSSYLFTCLFVECIEILVISFISGKYTNSFLFLILHNRSHQRKNKIRKSFLKYLIYFLLCVAQLRLNSRVF